MPSNRISVCCSCLSVVDEPLIDAQGIGANNVVVVDVAYLELNLDDWLVVGGRDEDMDVIDFDLVPVKPACLRATSTTLAQSADMRPSSWY